MQSADKGSNALIVLVNLCSLDPAYRQEPFPD